MQVPRLTQNHNIVAVKEAAKEDQPGFIKRKEPTMANKEQGKDKDKNKKKKKKEKDTKK
jgi:hypothetical protein